MKKILKILLTTFILVLLIGCNKVSDKKIGILIYDENDTFMQEYVNELKGKIKNKAKYNVSYAEKSQYVQNKQFNKYLDENYDLIIINAVDRLSSTTLVQKAETKGIPLIFINREPLDDLKNSVNSYYVGANSLQMGQLQAQLVLDMLEANELPDLNGDGVIQIVILKGEQGHQDAEKRTSEVIEQLKRLNISYEMLAISVARWNKSLAEIETKRLFEKFDNIELIISNNDDMALGAISYLIKTDYYEEHNELPVKIIAVDGTKQGISAIESSLLYGTVINDYIQQTECIDKLIDYLLFDIVDENVDYDNRFLLIDGQIRIK